MKNKERYREPVRIAFSIAAIVLCVMGLGCVAVGVLHLVSNVGKLCSV